MLPPDGPPVDRHRTDSRGPTARGRVPNPSTGRRRAVVTGPVGVGEVSKPDPKMSVDFRLVPPTPAFRRLMSALLLGALGAQKCSAEGEQQRNSAAEDKEGARDADHGT